FGPRQLVAHLLVLLVERVAARVLAQHDTVGFHADRLGRHDFVGDPVLEYAVLMDARLVREGVLADDGLVRLHQHARDVGERLAGTEQLFSYDAVLEGHQILAHAHRHDDLFERGVAGALADAVDRAFDLPRPGGHGRQRVRGGQPQIVVAMHADHGAVNVAHALTERVDDVRVFG